MNPQQQFCPNQRCHASGQKDQGNIVIHSRQERRYKCTCCGKTFSETKGTAVFGLKKPVDLFVLVVTLLAYGCPVQAIVAAFQLDERTVTAWLHKAGQHSQKVHQQMVGDKRMDLSQVQADEIKVKTQGGTLWLAMAIMVSTRLWLGGAVSPHRDRSLIRALVDQVRAVALCRPLLLAADGWVSYIAAFQQAFRSPLRTGQRGRPRLIAWPDLVIVQVIKQCCAGQWSVTRRIVQGSEPMVTALLHASQQGGCINTAYIERLNATFRQRLHSLTRRTRTLARLPQTIESGMALLGCVYNLCTWHKSLRLPLYVGRRASRHWVKRTPAMAAGLTDHCWSIHELLHFKVPTAYRPLKRRGRAPKVICSCGFA